MVHFTCCFQCPFCSGRKWQKSPVFHCMSGCFFFFLNLQGEILHKYILFSCCQWEQKILFKVSLWLVEVAVQKKKLLMIGKKKHKHRLQSSGFKHVDQWQPNEFWMHRKKDLEMTARNKTTMSCPYFFHFYKKQTGPTWTPNSWSLAPTSIGAMSMMGRRDVFVVL